MIKQYFSDNLLLMRKRVAFRSPSLSLSTFQFEVAGTRLAVCHLLK